jgi:hypothetical protein
MAMVVVEKRPASPVRHAAQNPKNVRNILQYWDLYLVRHHARFSMSLTPRRKTGDFSFPAAQNACKRKRRMAKSILS